MHRGSLSGHLLLNTAGPELHAVWAYACCAMLSSQVTARQFFDMKTGCGSEDHAASACAVNT